MVNISVGTALAKAGLAWALRTTPGSACDGRVGELGKLWVEILGKRPHVLSAGARRLVASPPTTSERVIKVGDKGRTWRGVGRGDCTELCGTGAWMVRDAPGLLQWSCAVARDETGLFNKSPECAGAERNLDGMGTELVSAVLLSVSQSHFPTCSPQEAQSSSPRTTSALLFGAGASSRAPSCKALICMACRSTCCFRSSFSAHSASFSEHNASTSTTPDPRQLLQSAEPTDSLQVALAPCVAGALGHFACSVSGGLSSTADEGASMSVSNPHA
mmetsp:Transcript_9801/g.27374  ORF Transcript_9801/g.27374 Transcript_9801/m.27374 type:complete len:274 (-) Transcript_9801:1159-1980(-)